MHPALIVTPTQRNVAQGRAIKATTILPRPLNNNNSNAYSSGRSNVKLDALFPRSGKRRLLKVDWCWWDWKKPWNMATYRFLPTHRKWDHVRRTYRYRKVQRMSNFCFHNWLTDNCIENYFKWQTFFPRIIHLPAYYVSRAVRYIPNSSRQRYGWCGHIEVE